MKYRPFGKLDFEVSALSFGCMRLPMIDHKNGNSQVDEKESISMIHYAIDQGVNYIDTAYPYHNGESEIITGKALKENYRQKVKLATKSPLWLINSGDDFDKILNEQLTKLQTDHIDFYLMHALDNMSWQKVLKLNLLQKAEDALKNGKIGHIGFSFHDNFATFQQIIDGYDQWEFCQIQYNFLDTDNQAGIKGLKYAASKGLAVVIMEPLFGGRLANPPGNILKTFELEFKKHTAAEWALQWLWNQPEVSTVLSGMSTLQQVKDNIQYAVQSGTNHLSSEDLNFIKKLTAKYKESTPIPCTKCNYCMPCPNGVMIPRTFEIYNDGIIHDAMQSAREIYQNWFGAGNKADACIQCRVCEDQCPQKIQISQWMAKINSEIG